MKTAEIDIRDAFFDEVYRLAASDRDVIFLTADMGAFSLNRFKADLRDQYINVGVAEQNLVGIAAGLALAGKKVFIYTIAPFATQRCYEQLKVDISGMGLPVTIIGSGPGITYSSDGPTHHAVQDVAIMRALPGMTIFNPADAASAAAAARLAYESAGPVYVRIDKGKPTQLYDTNHDFTAGLSRLKPGRDLTIIATGVMVPQALKAAGELAGRGVDAGVVDVYRLQPLNEALLVDIVAEAPRLVTLEEHLLVGGLGSAVAELMADRAVNRPLKRIGINNAVCPGYGDRQWMHEHYGLDAGSIVGNILDWMGKRG
jgi:transketolase